MENQDEEYVDDITERVFLIQRELEAGRLKIAPHLIDDIYLSLSKIKLRPDRKVDPDTVDGRIRATGAAVRHFTDRIELKNKYSLLDLQESYFNMVFSCFGDIYKMLIDSGAEPHKLSSFMATKEEFVNPINEKFSEIYQNFIEFWETASEIGVIHLQDGSQIKANFSGDLFPSYNENSVSVAGLYVDTIILPCPILRVGRLHGTLSKTEFCRILLKHVLTCMTYKEVAIEEFDPPIALVLPDVRDYSKDDKERLMQTSWPFILRHASFLYGREFSEKDEFEEFSLALPDVDSVLKELKNPQRLIYDSGWGGDARSQILRHMSDEERVPAKIYGDHVGMAVFFNCMSRMPQALAAKENAQYLGSTPLINAETSWLHYTWLLEYDSKSYKGNSDGIKDLHMVHAMSAGMDDGFSWLGKIPIKNIIELRRNDLLSEVRRILSCGVGEIIATDKERYIETTQRVIDNVDGAFIKHQRFLAKARKEKLKIYGIDIVPCIASGAIAITAAYTGNVALGTISAGLGMMGFPSLKDIRSKIKESDERISNYKKTATGILFKSIY